MQRLAEQIDMELLETAKGIIAVSNSNIVKEIKNVTVAKGYNPSDFCLVAFGGSGPLHAAELMEEMMIQKAPDSEDTGTFGCLWTFDGKHAQRLCTDQSHRPARRQFCCIKERILYFGNRSGGLV